MSRSLGVLRLVLRLEQAGLLAAGLLLTVMALGVTASFESIVGTTEAERLASARQLAELAPYTGLLLPIPERVETLAGFVQWRAFGGLSLFVAAWALLAGVAAVRGDEERGRLEQWLVAGVARQRWMGTRAIGFAVVSLGAVTLSGVAAAGGAVLGGGALATGALAGACIALWALGLACFGVALLAAQVAATRRGGLVLAGGTLLILYGLNSVPRGSGAVPPSRWLSPFYWYDRSKPLVPGGHLDVPATLGLLLAAALLTLLAGLALARRDLGAPLFLRRPRAVDRRLVPSTNPAWRTAPTAALYEGRFVLLGSAGAAAAGVLALVGLARPIAAVLLTSPATRGSERLLATGDPERALLGAFMFGLLQLVIALYAVAEAGRWAAEETSGRLAMSLSAPVSRRRLVLERALVLASGLVVIASAGAAAGLLGTGAAGSPLGVGEVVAATLALLPFGLSFGGLGALLAGTWPRAVVPALGAFAAGSFFLLEFGLLFGWPAWLTSLSVFGLYGLPLTEGLSATGLIALAGASLAGFGTAVIAQRQRDIGR